MKVKELIAMLVADGWVQVRMRGSHRQYGHRLVAAVLTVNPDGKGAHRYQVRLLLEMIEEFGLSMDG